METVAVEGSVRIVNSASSMADVVKRISRPISMGIISPGEIGTTYIVEAVAIVALLMGSS